jgi:aspartyl-tRNA(Asn)/glutamyl-tRNA(Gln) amidotransferase subunit A
MEAGGGYSAADLWEAQYARTDCFGKIQKILVAFDLIASPTLSAAPLPVGIDPLARITIAGRDAGTIRGAWYPYTFPFNLTGHPALSLPCGWTEERMPIGLQLVGRWHDDRFLLDVAERLETAWPSPSPRLAGAKSMGVPKPSRIADDFGEEALPLRDQGYEASGSANQYRIR